MTEADNGTPAAESDERIPLHNSDAAFARRRTVSGIVGVVIFAAAAGGIAGLIGGRAAGLVAAAVVGLPILYVVLSGSRRQLWLDGNELVVRTWGSRRVDLRTARAIDLVVMEIRGVRTVALLVTPARSGKAVKVDLAAYGASGGSELGILALRKLANALMHNTEANGMIFAELLVAQLRSEARGDGMEGRPLHRLASAAPKGKLAQRYSMEVLGQFVAALKE